ncbi:MAG: phage tail protein [Acidimicrobiales bacterium]|jgi:phage tail-like protein
MADATSDPAVSVCFTLTIDGHDLGAFMSCEGLSLEVQIEQREEGGNNLFVHQLPGRVKYANVKFTRPINADSNKVRSWLASMTKEVKRTTAQIVAMTLEGKQVASWGLVDVIPVKWQGPSFSLDSPKVATETLELAHHGFLGTGS